MNNMMEKVAENYGFRLNDTFYVTNVDLHGAQFKFTDSGLKQVESTCGDITYNTEWVLSQLIMGKLCIIPVPTKPLYGTLYYTYDTADWDIITAKWEDTPVDYARLLTKMVFSTDNMAKKCKDTIAILLRNEVSKM